MKTHSGNREGGWTRPGMVGRILTAAFFAVSAAACHIGNYVWFDADQDGIQDSGEQGVAGVTVRLYDSNSVVIATTTTDSTGWYEFAVGADQWYSVGFVLPANYLFTVANAGSNDAVDSDADAVTGRTALTFIGNGEYDDTWDAGLVTNNPCTAAIGDYVWLDADGDGVQDTNETGVAGVTVTLYNAGGTALRTTNTSATGSYRFSGLAAGTYSVGFALPANHAFTGQDLGGNDAKDSDANPATGRTTNTVLSAGETDLTWDAGLVKVAPLPAAIGDRVWLDVDADGVQDTNELGIANFPVTLYNSNGVAVANTTTDADGYYLFGDLSPGVYSIGFQKPADVLYSPRDAGGDDARDSDADPATGRTIATTLVAGETDRTWDAGVRPLCSALGTIGDRVWKDTDADGIQDSGETGMSGVTVILRDYASNELARTTTDAQGYYVFGGLRYGVYVVQFVKPAGYDFTARDAGGDNALDSDADRTTGYARPTSLEPGESDLTWDAGLVCAGTVPCPPGGTPPPCTAFSLSFNGSSATTGAFGNIRTFTSSGLSVRVSAFSRAKTTASWQTAYLGLYSGGLGVTDSADGDGSGNRHTVDNIDRDNYVLFEFSKPVVVDRAYLGYVSGDSDLTAWIGTFNDPYNNHLTLSDTVLAACTSEDNPSTSTTARWADLNAGLATGNVFVVAAWPGDTTPEDQFKIETL